MTSINQTKLLYVTWNRHTSDCVCTLKAEATFTDGDSISRKTFSYGMSRGDFSYYGLDPYNPETFWPLATKKLEVEIDQYLRRLNSLASQD